MVQACDIYAISATDRSDFGEFGAILPTILIYTHSLMAAHNWLWVVASSKLADPQQQPMRRKQ